MDLPQAPTRFGVSATGLLGETDRLIKGACALYAQIVESISPEKANFANTISPIAQIENKLISAKKLFGFYNSTSTSSELREASARASVLFNKFESETLMRDDLFRLVNIVVCNQRKENLSSEDAYYLENKHQSFLRNGLGIQNEEQTARFTQVQTLLREQTLKAQRCINKSHGLWLSSDELKGFLKSSLSTLKKDEGENETQLWFPLTRGQIVKALQFVEKESTRRKIYVANDNRCLENVSTLKEIILLRDESARLLGFFSFMDLSILDKMANSADLIANYVSELRSALRTAGQRETQDLLELKKKDQRNDPDASSEMDTKFYLWDHNFYKTILTKARTNFNEERFSEYFPLEQTLTGIMDIYSTLFGLRFVKISTGKFPLFGNDHVMIWHEDVSIYSVWSNESQGSDFLGYLYLDLFPRENKYNHAGHYGLIPGYEDIDGEKKFPSSALVMNLAKPLVDRPSLLRHDEIRSVFHEFGHAVHNLISKVKYAVFHGTSAARDFVEIPSIMLENWVWDPSLIKKLGSHYSYLSEDYLKFWKSNNNNSNSTQPSKTLDDTLIQSLIQTRHTDGVMGVLKQCHIAEFDIAIHSQKSRHDVEALNLSSKWNQLQKEITLLDGPEADGEGWEWGHGSARFGLLVRGYEAGYCSYPLGKAYAQDLFKTRFEVDLMSQGTALEFRRVVLEPGGSRNGAELLKDFLGRDVTVAARFQELVSATISQHKEKRDSVDVVKKDISTLEYVAQDDPWGFGSKSDEWHAEYNKKLLRRIDYRMLPLLSYMFLVSYLDRSNLAQARLGNLQQDLGLHGTQFNTATSILFVGYLLMQLPSNLLFTRVKPAIYLPTVMVIWGVISGCQAATQNFGGLLAVRFLLGFAEAPYFPGAVYMLSTWYTRAELSKRFAFFYAGPALANMFGGLIAAGVLKDMDGYRGLAAWRWLFLIEALMTVCVAVLAYFVLPNFPHTTKWLSEEERAYAQWRIASDIGESADDDDDESNKGLMHAAKLAITDYRTWIFVLMQHCVLLSQTVTFFFPSVVNTLGYGNIETLLLTAPVWVATFILNLFVMWSASRTNERCFHLCCSMALTIAGNIMLISIHLRGPRFLGMFFMAMGAQPAFMIILTWVPNSFPRPLGKRAAITALVNMIGNTSNIYGSYLYPSSAAPQYVFGGATIAGVGVLCMACAITMRFILVRENKKLDEVEREGDFTLAPHLTVRERERRDLARTGFRYIY